MIGRGWPAGRRTAPVLPLDGHTCTGLLQVADVLDQALTRRRERNRCARSRRPCHVAVPSGRGRSDYGGGTGQCAETSVASCGDLVARPSAERRSASVIGEPLWAGSRRSSASETCRAVASLGSNVGVEARERHPQELKAEHDQHGRGGDQPRGPGAASRRATRPLPEALVRHGARRARRRAASAWCDRCVDARARVARGAPAGRRAQRGRHGGDDHPADPHRVQKHAAGTPAARRARRSPSPEEKATCAPRDHRSPQRLVASGPTFSSSSR